MKGRPVKRISCRKSHVYEVCGCTVWGLRKVPVGSAFSKDMRAGSNAPVPENTGVRVPSVPPNLFLGIFEESALVKENGDVI